MIIGRNFADKLYSANEYYEDEKLYSTGDDYLDDLLEKAFCEGYEYAQREFAWKTDIRNAYQAQFKNPETLGFNTTLGNNVIKLTNKTNKQLQNISNGRMTPKRQKIIDSALKKRAYQVAELNNLGANRHQFVTSSQVSDYMKSGV